MMAVVQALNFTSHFNRMHEIRHLKTPNQENNRISASRLDNFSGSSRHHTRSAEKAANNQQNILNNNPPRRSLLEIRDNGARISLHVSTKAVHISSAQSEASSSSFHTASSSVVIIEPIAPAKKVQAKPKRIGKRLKKSDPFICKYPYTQKVFYERTAVQQPLFEPNPSDPSIVEQRLFSLENADEYNKACVRQSSIEVPCWRIIDLREWERRVSHLQKRSSKSYIDKEDLNEAQYVQRHAKPEQEEIKCERRCLQLQLENERRSQIEARDRRTWEHKSQHRNKQHETVEFSEEQALNMVPRQLTLSPSKINSIKIAQHIPLVAFGALVPPPEQRLFSLTELRKNYSSNN